MVVNVVSNREDALLIIARPHRHAAVHIHIEVLCPPRWWASIRKGGGGFREVRGGKGEMGGASSQAHGHAKPFV